MKCNTQDDPFDERLAKRLGQTMPSGTKVVAASGPLISPDMVVAAPEGVREIREHEGGLGTTEALGIEVKKLERGASGRIARSSGVDYNSTPPSKTIAVVHEGEPIELPGFYRFLDRAATLIHRRPDLDSETGLSRIGTVERTGPDGSAAAASSYAVYRANGDIPAGDGEPFHERNPFPAVQRRTEDTQARGRFHLTL